MKVRIVAREQEGRDTYYQIQIRRWYGWRVAPLRRPNHTRSRDAYDHIQEWKHVLVPPPVYTTLIWMGEI